MPGQLTSKAGLRVVVTLGLPSFLNPDKGQVLFVMHLLRFLNALPFLSEKLLGHLNPRDF